MKSKGTLRGISNVTESGGARLWRGVRARLREVKFSFACQKRTRKAPAIERLGGGEAMKAPVGLSSRQSGLRSKCRVFSAARTGTHEKGAARPFQTPKGLSKPKNASRFAKRIFLCFSHLRLRRRFHVSAGRYRQQRGNTSCGAANRRNDKKVQQRRPPPVAETGRSCWGSGQQDASGSEADAGSRNPS